MKSSAVDTVEKKILRIRDQKVIIDTDLAELYGVTTKVLNQAVKRNIDRFPEDFMFKLTGEEKHEVVTNCDHLASLKFSPVLPNAFTEHGAIMAARSAPVHPCTRRVARLSDILSARYIRTSCSAHLFF